MEPFYEDKRITLYHADCKADGLVPNIIKKFGVSLVATDPPYGIKYRQGDVPLHFLGQRFRHHYAPIAGDDSKFIPTWLLQLKLPLILWGANYFSDWLPSSSGWVVWDKARPEGMDQAMGGIGVDQLRKGGTH